MRILHFSTDDITGGAAKAAYRLHNSLCEAGQDSRMIVLRKRSDDDRITQAPAIQINPWESRFQRLRHFVPGLRAQLPAANYTFNFDAPPQINFELLLSQIEPPDVICLHWITDLLDARSIRKLHDHFRCPIVWVMADQEPLTGGCHYSFGCEGFTRECGNCPQLTPAKPDDHSRVTWQRKKELLSHIPICFVAPTSWGRERLRQSSLFRHHRCELIPYPIDAQTFRPFEQNIARDLLHLPQDKKIIFFGATYLEDRRKGMPLLIKAFDSPAIRRLDNLFLLVAGLNGNQLMSKVSLPGKYIGQLQDELTLALAYQAADIFVCPSVEDAGPMMIPEAMMCGTPVVAFNTGGAPDLIESGKNGYLAKLPDAPDTDTDTEDTDELATGVLALLEADNGTAFRVSALGKAREQHLPEVVTKRHLELYRSLLPDKLASLSDVWDRL